MGNTLPEYAGPYRVQKKSRCPRLVVDCTCCHLDPSRWLLQGLPRGSMRDTLIEFFNFLVTSADTFRYIIRTLGSFPLSDMKNMRAVDRSYLIAYIQDLWILLPRLRDNYALALAEASLCSSVHDVLRLQAAYLQGKTAANFNHAGRLSEETIPMVSSFLRLTRLGIITSSSQWM
jgi:hypothetical protein